MGDPERNRAMCCSIGVEKDVGMCTEYREYQRDGKVLVGFAIKRIYICGVVSRSRHIVQKLAACCSNSAFLDRFGMMSLCRFI